MQLTPIQGTQLIRVGLIGHRVLADATAATQLREEARQLFGAWQQQYTTIEVYSQLAIGADTILTEVALAFGAILVNVVPFHRFEDDFSANELVTYRHLRDLAVRIHIQPFTNRSDEAYLRAGQTVVDGIDVLVAAWDGAAARGKGGTTDIIDYARAKQKVVQVLPTSR